METVKINKSELIENMWESGYGKHYLVIDADGDQRITWADDNRQWDPWQDKDFVAAIPAIFPEGEGREGELAQDLLDSYQDSWDYESHLDATGEDVQIVEYVENTYPEEWETYNAEVADWTAQEFLNALNGEFNDLGITAAWGYTGGDEYSGYGEEAVRPPFAFELI